MSQWTGLFYVQSSSSKVGRGHIIDQIKFNSTRHEKPSYLYAHLHKGSISYKF